MKRFNLVTVCALALASAAVGVSGVVQAADKEKPPQISGDIAKPLKGAQDDLKNKKFDDAITKLNEAKASKGKKTEYDNYVINEMLAVAYYQSQQLPNAAPLLRESAMSQYSTPEQTKQFLMAAMGIYYQALKNYPECITTGEELIKRGDATSDVYTTIALSYQQQGKNKEAAQTIQQLIDKQPKPEEKLLQFQWNSYVKANDPADASKVIEELVKFYPKSDYWLNALSPLLKMQVSDAHLQLDIFRLMNEVGVLTRPGDYSEMAGLSLDQGYPGETVAVLKKAFANNVFTDPRDVGRYQHLLTGAQQRADTDQKTLPQQEQQAKSAATGDALVTVGAAYMTYDQPDKAVDLIQQGIQKGNLKFPDQANLLLGMAQLRLHKNAEARKAFSDVAKSSNEGYAHLGRLWELHVEGGGKTAETAKS